MIIFGNYDPPQGLFPLQPITAMPERDLEDPTPCEQLITILRDVVQQYIDRLGDTTKRYRSPEEEHSR